MKATRQERISLTFAFVWPIASYLAIELPFLSAKYALGPDIPASFELALMAPTVLAIVALGWFVGLARGALLSLGLGLAHGLFAFVMSQLRMPHFENSAGPLAQHLFAILGYALVCWLLMVGGMAARLLWSRISGSVRASPRQ